MRAAFALVLSAVCFLWSVVLNPKILFAEENPFSIVNKASYTFKSDVNDQPGTFQESLWSIRLGYHHIMANGMPLDIKIGGNHYFFKETTSVDIPEKAKARGAWISSRFPIPSMDQRFLFGLELNPVFQNAKGAKFDTDAFRFNFSPTFIFKRDKDFEFVIGAKIRPRYDKVVLPIIGFNYQATDKLSFNLVSDEPSIDYKITDKTKLFWGFNYLLDEFEVTAGSLDGSILEVQNFTTGAGIEHQFNNHFVIRSEVGGVFDRIIKYQDDNGKLVPKPGVYFKLSLDAHF